MAALTQERDTPKRHRHYAEAYAAKGNAKGYSGGLAAADANGLLVAAADAANLKVLGRLNQSFDTTATGPAGQLADAAISVEVEQGIFEFATEGANAITVADVGKFCFVLNDQTVVRAAGTAQSIKAGKVIAVPSAARVIVDTLAVPGV